MLTCPTPLPHPFSSCGQINCHKTHPEKQTKPLGLSKFAIVEKNPKKKIGKLTDAFATTQKQMQKFLENFISNFAAREGGGIGVGETVVIAGGSDSYGGRGCCHFKYEVIARVLSVSPPPSPSLMYLMDA